MDGERRTDSLVRFATAKLAGLERQTLRRRIGDTDRGPQARATRDGHELISFSCNDYLGLSQHPAVKRAAIDAVECHGAGAGASRLVTGSHPLYRALGRSAAGRQEAYRALFRQALGDDFLDGIRAATNGGWAFGDERFRRAVAEAAGRRAAKLPRGRPRAERDDRPENLL